MIHIPDAHRRFKESRVMPTIRIPEDRWGQVWRTLVASGPVSRISAEPIYIVSEKQLRLLRRKKLPFELLTESPLRIH
jgi:hypothetical protein